MDHSASTKRLHVSDAVIYLYNDTVKNVTRRLFYIYTVIPGNCDTAIQEYCVNVVVYKFLYRWNFKVVKKNRNPQSMIH